MPPDDADDDTPTDAAPTTDGGVEAADADDAPSRTASPTPEMSTDGTGGDSIDSDRTRPTDAEDPPPASADAGPLSDTQAETETDDADSPDARPATSQSDASPRAGEVSLATLFEVLGNERRRHVIQVVRDRESVSLTALARAVAAREHDVDPENLTRRQRKTTYSALQQTHLPKMDDAGVLTFDKAASEVTAADAIVEYTLYLDVVSSGGVRRSGLYLYVAAAGGVVAAGLWAGLPPFAWLAPLVWGGLLTASVAVVAVVQLYYHPLFPDRLPIG